MLFNIAHASQELGSELDKYLTLPKVPSVSEDET